MKTGTPTKPLTLTATDFENNKRYEVTYYYGYFTETGTACICVEYGKDHFFKLCHNYEVLPNQNWAYFYFQESMYWLVLPLLNEGVVKMNRQTHCYTISRDSTPKNMILCEINEKYFL